jgi:predicted MFS family arabinose efflux permease
MRNKPASRAVARTGGLFAPRQVLPGELPAIMKKHIFTATLGGAWGNLLAGIIYIYFGNSIGMTQLEWGILGGIGAWVVVVQPLGAVIGERLGYRKRFWFLTAIADRVLRLAAIAAAFFLWRAGYHIAYLVFMVGICLGTLIGSLSPGPWYGWFATIIPKETQGTFWGRRDSWISLVVIAVALPSGLLMDFVPQSDKLPVSAIILVAASLLGFMDLCIHVTIPEPPHARSSSGRTLAGMLLPLRDRRFRPWLTFNACWNLSQGIGGSLCTLYFMDNLGFKNDFLGGVISITVLGLVGTFVASRRVGRMIDRFGIKRMLLLGYFFWATLPLLWMLATPRTAVYWIGLQSVIGGAFSAAANNAGVKLVTRFPAPEESGMYMAVSTMVGSVALGLGSIIMGTVLNALRDWSVTVLGLAVCGFTLMFTISFVLRMATTFVLIPKIRVTGSLPDEEIPFLLPLFFEGVPGINRIMRTQGERKAARKRRRPR